MSTQVHTNDAYIPDPDQEGDEEEEFTVLPAITKRGSIPSDNGVSPAEVDPGQLETDHSDPNLQLEPHIPSKVSFASNAKAEAEFVLNGGRKRKAAVTVRSAYKQYGGNGPQVLKNFNMTVEHGTIYALLGSSGCGKTTLLSCVVGLRNLNSGEVLVFGAKPGTKECGVPGKRVGYMPQDAALYNDFSIEESMTYFGRLYSMKREDIESSRDFLVGFLDLPKASRRICTLSGGQKRRVSLALALIHNPPLLILDEPTVGVDELLRASIWSHLCKLVSSHGTTVIVTTHYIEEARASNTIGLMRGGKLLTEKSPALLLSEHNTNLLQDIVLKLCQKDALRNPEDEDNETEFTGTEVANNYAIKENGYDNDKRKASTSSDIERRLQRRRVSFLQVERLRDNTDLISAANRVWALIGKNWSVMTRNLILLMFMIAVPSLQMITVGLAIGNDPKPLYLGVVNYETNASDLCLTSFQRRDEGCDVELLSCQFLSWLPNDTIYLKPFDNEEEARDAVHLGNIWGFLTFPEGFSDSVYTRASSGNIIDKETLQGSLIPFEMDMTNKQIQGTIKRLVGDAYEDFVTNLLILCGFHPELGESPIKFKAIYGADNTDFREFMAPSILVGITFFFPLCSSSISIIWDKKQGTLERARVAGVRTYEILAAFLVTEGAILLVQTSFSMSILGLAFGILPKGSVFLCAGIVLLMGFSGVSMGFLLSSFCTEEIEAVLLSMASFFPNFLLAGMLWPVEGMPLPLQYFSYLLPCTLAGETIRSVVSRGWGFTHNHVWPGFASTFGWIVVYWTLTILIHQRVLSKR